MRLEEDMKFYKYKGFYIACFLGLLSILSIVGIQKSMKNKNTPGSQVAVQSSATPDASQTPEEQSTQDFAQLEEDFGDTQLAVIDQTETPTTTKTPAAKSDAAISSHADNAGTEKTTTQENQEDLAQLDNPEEAVSVLNAEEPAQGLTWPVQGDILMNYSMDRTVFFETLNQYKCNPAVLIAGKSGTEVVSACDCEIVDVKRNKETGLTLTAKAGDYTYIYGQLANPKVAKGDKVKEGTVIGTLAEPTSFYEKEGCHLYFQVKEGKESVNPLLLLK